MINSLQKSLIRLYLEYWNDYLTTSCMAESKEISQPCLASMVEEGKRLWKEFNEMADSMPRLAKELREISN